MALDIRSFFIGIGTVAGILAVGFGGGVLMGGVMTGDSKGVNKVERQAQESKDTKEARRPVEPVIVPQRAKAEPAPQPPPAPAQMQTAPAPAPAQAQAAPAPAPEPVSTQPAPAPQAPPTPEPKP